MFTLEIRQLIIKKFGKVYLYLYLCGNYKKLKIDQKKALIEEDNQVLREEFHLSKFD